MRKKISDPYPNYWHFVRISLLFLLSSWSECCVFTLLCSAPGLRVVSLLCYVHLLVWELCLYFFMFSSWSDSWELCLYFVMFSSWSESCIFTFLCTAPGLRVVSLLVFSSWSESCVLTLLCSAPGLSNVSLLCYVQLLVRVLCLYFVMFSSWSECCVFTLLCSAPGLSAVLRHTGPAQTFPLLSSRDRTDRQPCLWYV